MADLTNNTKKLMALKARLSTLKRFLAGLFLPDLFLQRVKLLLEKIDRMLDRQLEAEKKEHVAVTTRNNMAAQKSQDVEDARRRAEEAKIAAEDEVREIEEFLVLLEKQLLLEKEISVVQNEIAQADFATPEAAISAAAKQQQKTDLPKAKPDANSLKQQQRVLLDRTQRLKEQHQAAAKLVDIMFTRLLERANTYSPAATVLFQTLPGKLLLSMMSLKMDMGKNNNNNTDDENPLVFRPNFKL